MLYSGNKVIAIDRDKKLYLTQQILKKNIKISFILKILNLEKLTK